MENYQWKLKGLSKKIDPDDAVKELQRIRDKYGSLTPEKIVHESRSKKAVLHNYFEWDDDKAAFNWRLQQARTMINNIEVTVISDGEPIQVPVYEVVETVGYKHIESFTVDDMEVVRRSVITELERLKRKLLIYDKFIKAGEKIQVAITELVRV